MPSIKSILVTMAIAAVTVAIIGNVSALNKAALTPRIG